MMQESNFSFALGGFAEDTITGCRGVVVARCDYAFCSPRIGLQMKPKEGETVPPSVEWFDQAALILLNKL